MAYTLQFNTSNVSLLSTWAKNGSVVTRHANLAEASRSIVVSGIPEGAVIESAFLNVKMRGNAAYGTNKEICTVNGVNCNSSGNSEPITNSIPITITGNQTVNLAFAYKGNELVGSRAGINEYSFTANFEEITLLVAYSMPLPPPAPIIQSGWYTLEPYNVGTQVEGFSGYAVGYSKIRVDFDPSKVSVASGAHIVSFIVSYNGIVSTQQYSDGHVYINTGVIQSENSSIVLMVTDSNGNTATATDSVSAYPYSRPTLTGISAYRSNSAMTADDNGTYITAKAVLNYSSLNGWNTCTLTAKYKLHGGTYTAPTTLTNNTLEIINSSPISPQSNYMVRIEATDRLGNSAIYEQTISGGIEMPFHIMRGGKGAAFGKVADQSGVLDVFWKLNASKGIGFAIGDGLLRASWDIFTLPNLPSDVGSWDYGWFLEMGYGSDWGSRYLLITDSYGITARLYFGHRLNGASTITWFAVDASSA